VPLTASQGLPTSRNHGTKTADANGVVEPVRDAVRRGIIPL
jgi:hypothetical protein